MSNHFKKQLREGLMNEHVNNMCDKCGYKYTVLTEKLSHCPRCKKDRSNTKKILKEIINDDLKKQIFCPVCNIMTIIPINQNLFNNNCFLHKESLNWKYIGIPISDKFNGSDMNLDNMFEWDDNWLEIIEEETKLKEGNDFIRDLDGTLIILNEEAKKYFQEG